MKKEYQSPIVTVLHVESHQSLLAASITTGKGIPGDAAESLRRDDFLLGFDESDDYDETW